VRTVITPTRTTIVLIARTKGGKDDGERVYNHFLRFGSGTENFSDFNVSLGWSDVEGIIKHFFEMGHSEAVRFDRARKLAAAVEEFAKHSN
jgi:hypothetical protein